MSIVPGPIIPSPFEESILQSLRRIARAVDIHSRGLSLRHHLTAPQILCLRQLRRAGPLTPGALARDVSSSQATVTGILDRLEARGLVTRTRSSEDKRRVIVALTDSGAAMAQEAPSPLQTRLAERLGELPADRQAALAGALQELVEMMETPAVEAVEPAVEAVELVGVAGLPPGEDR